MLSRPGRHRHPHRPVAAPAEVLAADKRLCQVAAYWKKQIRAAWKQADPYGQLPRPEHGMDLLRAKAYLALLLGQPLDVPPAGLLPPAQQAAGTAGPDSPASTPGPDSPADGPGRDSGRPGRDHGPGRGGPDSPAGNARPGSPAHPEDPAGDGRDGAADSDGATGPARPGSPAYPGDQRVPAGLRRPGPVPGAGGSDPVAGLPPLAGLINLTIPVSTLMQLSDHPGDAAGYGPLSADTARQLACALAGHRATRWHITVTAPDGTALATGTHRGPAGHGPDGHGNGNGTGWTVKVIAEPIATTSCDHRNQEPGYRPSPALQRLIRARTGSCCGPGCRRSAARADIDHTLAYDHGGITCECNCGPVNFGSVTR